ncbi:MAG: hypothetical protein SPL99_10560 [Catonella sp.]|nr:hypothetical protein [Catonella sp.]MDY6356225.1 hypothetical protein [Catonella sp.]
MKRKLLMGIVVISLFAFSACGNNGDSRVSKIRAVSPSTVVSATSETQEAIDYSKAFLITEAAENDAEGALYKQEIGSEGGRSYKITAEMDIRRFSLNEVNFDGGGNISAGHAIFEADNMKKGDYIFMTDVIPEGIPSRMIMWQDEEGNTYKRAITESGKDGALILMEVE